MNDMRLEETECVIMRERHRNGVSCHEVVNMCEMYNFRVESGFGEVDDHAAI